MPDTTNYSQARGYLEGRAHSIDPLDVVHSFYRIAIESTGSAIAHLRDGDAMARSRAVTRAEEAVHELSIALDRSVDAPFVKTLADLYAYVLARLVQGHSTKSEQAFEDARSILQTLESAWAGVREKESTMSAATVPQDVDAYSGTQESANPSSAYGAVAAPAASRDWSA